MKYCLSVTGAGNMYTCSLVNTKLKANRIPPNAGTLYCPPANSQALYYILFIEVMIFVSTKH